MRLCGKLLSENIDLPLHTAFPPSQLDPFLLRQMQTLARDDIASWALLRKAQILYVGPNFSESDCAERKEMLGIRTSAVYDKDEYSIGCLAVLVVAAAQLQCMAIVLEGPAQEVTKRMRRKEIMAQLEREFGMPTEELENAMRLAKKDL